MAIKAGFTVIQPQAGVINPNLSSWDYEENWHPYSASKSAKLLDTAIKRNFPVNVAWRNINGFITTSYGDDYYHRIHIIPQQVDLGNVVSTQEFSVYVWNAHFISKRLNEIKGVSDGITLEGKNAPYTYSALEEQNYKVLVSPVGSTVIDDNIIFDFGDELPNILLTGNRIVAFLFMPNWSEDGIKERLEWSTDVLKSASGIEQRSALYLTPRRYFNGDFLVHAGDKQRFNNMMSWSARVWAIPLWPYIQQLKTAVKEKDLTIPCITENMEFKEDGLVILWRGTSNYEVAEVATINSDSLTLVRPLLSDWSIGTRLYPAVAAEFTKQPELIHKTDNLQSFDIEFRLSETNPYVAKAPPTNYLNYPVLELKPDESEDLTSQYQRLLKTLDNGMALPRTIDTSDHSFYLQSYRWIGAGREERAAFKELIYFLNGQQKALWLPSFSDDLTVVDIITSNEPVITIAECGYTNFALNDADKKHIAIYLTDGRIFYRQIINSEVRGETERLSINAPLGIQIRANQVRRISYLRLCRSNNDVVEINHITDSQGIARSNLTFTRVRDDEL